MLLHGLARTKNSMRVMQAELAQANFRVVNLGYPSRKDRIENLAPTAVREGVTACELSDGEAVHFVTHSMGGILIRYYLSKYNLEQLGRIVMLAPPNQGSQVVDSLGKMPGFKLLNGPAGLQLGTDANSIPLQLGAVDYPVGIIAGTRTFNPILSLFLPNPDDGKVSLENTKVEGMVDFIDLPVTHSFMMRNRKVIKQMIAFLQTGKFASKQL